METEFRWVRMELDSDGDARKAFREGAHAWAMLSMFVGSFVFDMCPFGPYTFPGGMTWNRRDEAFPRGDGHWVRVDCKGLPIPDVRVDGSLVVGFCRKLDALPAEDRGHLRSAMYAMLLAKKARFRGDVSEAWAMACSAIESVYLRPDKRGIYRAVDARMANVLGSTRVKTAMIREFVCQGEAMLESWYGGLTCDPYKIRSGFLHAGVIEFLERDPAAEDDASDLGRFLEVAQRRILDSVDLF
ncbi:MAG: hypothetical protein IPM29_04015 [Planctomycetes bacterium]|nr:hypothetical protein [Planctomycetota bacterium]